MFPLTHRFAIPRVPVWVDRRHAAATRSLSVGSALGQDRCPLVAEVAKAVGADVAVFLITPPLLRAGCAGDTLVETCIFYCYAPLAIVLLAETGVVTKDT